MFLTAPPPSPAIGRKQPSKQQVKKKPTLPPPSVVANKSPNVSRKTLPLCKMILELPVTNEVNISDSSDFDSDEEVINKVIKPQKSAKKKKKRKVKKRQKVMNQNKVTNEPDVELEEQIQVVSVLDISQASNIRAHSWHRTIISTPHR